MANVAERVTYVQPLLHPTVVLTASYIPTKNTLAVKKVVAKT